MTETSGCLGSYPKFLCNVGESPSSAYRPCIFNRCFCETGYSEGLSLLVLTMFDSHFLLCPACPIRLSKCQQLKKGHFIAQWFTFAPKKVNSLCSFFSAHYLILNRLVLPGADMSHCRKKTAYVIKTT